MDSLPTIYYNVHAFATSIAAEDDGGIRPIQRTLGWQMSRPYWAFLEAKRAFSHVDLDSCSIVVMEGHSRALTLQAIICVLHLGQLRCVHFKASRNCSLSPTAITTPLRRHLYGPGSDTVAATVARHLSDTTRALHRPLLRARRRFNLDNAACFAADVRDLAARPAPFDNKPPAFINRVSPPGLLSVLTVLRTKRGRHAPRLLCRMRYGARNKRHSRSATWKNSGNDDRCVRS
ncbi:hypothetical protein B0T24DRAFT_666868 [Lasiosphaeria ovina]|uniref:Uncharacterized protein n=1 Tax=Lasiosphaeria ovina TaxID=92902 RepID=A0AAE0N7Z8_9PEZI|nr:hypothetical protein B0T24DRAFT_666868 [Lasiosphaeria ovina]